MSIKEIFLEQKIVGLQRTISQMKTAMLNAIVDLQDGDEDSAIETLNVWVGENDD